MTLLDLLARNIGYVVQAPGGLGGECVDWSNLYLVEVRGQAAVQANAVDWAGKTIAGMTWVPNSATNYPKAGAIVVWHSNAGEGIGANGHIAVVLDADAMHLVTCDQNWPEGAPVSVILHPYPGVAGWFSPTP
jgi:CHAP domain